MVGANVKAETLSLMDSRSSIEEEMNAIIARLCAPGGPGLTSSLVDKEGFPRADIDVHAVLTDRHRLAVLRNDHKDITAQIEEKIYVLHSGGFTRDGTLPQKRTADGEEVRPQRVPSATRTVAQEAPAHATGRTETTPMEEDRSIRPFATFDEVTEGSPAALDGIVLGDQLIKFGSIEGGEDLLRRLAREGQMNEGRTISVVVLRRGSQIELSVTPRQWSGRGLLGCHIQVL
ncbi:hypothetical protein O6H91_22G042700 [Diphasiastrum complanatum]|uniref:Uncharacterized protein n=2 Tax=Diphasiastrum complanatum TaxID=34168 RepID=A0ACC2AET7_DIPCM|nr:hypothetical protein O6H91_22G042300 [Diphasiastrum complanatum]KAJ7516094.1 hypothetical protein O6H91_22G042700 [Diphasiastrum complanatum]